MTKKRLSKEDIKEQLKTAGVQPTVQRLAICEFMLAEDQHLTAEEIYQWAQKKLGQISLATIYNTLGTLVKIGLLREFRFPHSDKVIYDSRTDDHFHFLDEKTQKLYDIDSDALKSAIRLPKKYQISELEIFIKGRLT